MSLVAGLALAETAVESANIVGYTEQDIDANKLYMIGVQFEDVGSTDGAITFDSLIQMTGIEAYEDGDKNCAEIQVFNGATYRHYYYINDAWNADDEDVGHDCWAKNGYECTEEDLQSLGNGFWFKAPVAASGASIKVLGQVSAVDTMDVEFPANKLAIVANPFPVDTCFGEIVTTGVVAYEDGDKNCAEIQVFNGATYKHFYYTNDAWNADDEDVGYDCWSDEGYICEGVQVKAGESFWIKSPTAGKLTFSL